ncbi:interferon-stimulated 20 kDa exonuclease-like 2 isoform X2 [Labrus bergylta]|nr:interferon-stimulated 20 kDa exonuclease-like 2 [Labrus bergylta]
MSDVTINMQIDMTMSTRERPQGRENKQFKKKNFSNQRGRTEGKYKHTQRGRMSRHNHIQHQNGAPAQRPSFPASTNNKFNNSDAGSSAASAPSSSFKPSTSAHSKGIPPLMSRDSALHKPSVSACSLPPFTATVKNNGCHEKPKEREITSASTIAFCSVSGSRKQTKTAEGFPLKYVALDCEMVGSGPKGSINQLARCSMVNYDGDVIYDKFIIPSMPVTDYRTRWSGIRRCDLVNATPYAKARTEILRLLMGKVVIGHAIHNDFKVLSYVHPTAMTRDTSRIPLLNQKAGFSVGECASLKRLTKAIFNRDIQVGRMGHSSVEDAQATMELYKVVEAEWERELAFKSGKVTPRHKRTTCK